MVTSSLLVFASFVVQVRMPKEGRDENQSIQLINSIPFLNRFCLFELTFMVKTLIYPNIFHCALHISRLIDKPIEDSLANCYNMCSRHLTKTIAALEIVTNCRDADEKYKAKVANGGETEDENEEKKDEEQKEEPKEIAEGEKPKEIAEGEEPKEDVKVEEP